MPEQMQSGGDDSSLQVLLGLPGSNPCTPARLLITDSGYRARPESYLEQPRQANPRQTSEHSWVIDIGNPRQVVADFRPRALWGLDNGEPFTLLDAMMSVDGDLTQTYQGRQVLRGAHVDNDQVPTVGLRMAFPLAEPCGWMRQERVRTPRGALTPWSVDGRPGVQWEPNALRSLKSMALRHTRSVAALLSLWSGREVPVSLIEVELSNNGWCRVELPSTRPDREDVLSDLLPFSKVGLEVISRWLELAGFLGPVPHMAVRNREVGSGIAS